MDAPAGHALDPSAAMTEAVADLLRCPPDWRLCLIEPTGFSIAYRPNRVDVVADHDEHLRKSGQLPQELWIVDFFFGQTNLHSAKD